MIRMAQHLSAMTCTPFSATASPLPAFCCLGYAITSVIRNEDAALPTTMAITLPLYFISGVFVAITALPHWLADVGEIFPVRHLANALLVAYNPHTTGLGFAGWDLLIVAAWGALGLLIAIRKFSWLPLGRGQHEAVGELARVCRSDQRSGARLAQPGDAGGETRADAEAGTGVHGPDRSAIRAASSPMVRAESAAPTRSSSSARVSRPSATASHRTSTAVSRSASEARCSGWNNGPGRM